MKQLLKGCVVKDWPTWLVKKDSANLLNCKFPITNCLGNSGFREYLDSEERIFLGGMVFQGVLGPFR